MTKPYETRGRAARSRRSSSMQAQAQGPFPEALRFAPGSYKVNTGPDSAPEAMWSHRSIALAPKRQTQRKHKQHETNVQRNKAKQNATTQSNAQQRKTKQNKKNKKQCKTKRNNSKQRKATQNK